MKAFVQSGSGLDALALKDVADPPAPGRGEVTIAVRAVGLNYRDLLVLSGGAGGGGGDGMIPCSDAAGEIVAVGPEVYGYSVGDRVILTFNPDWIGGEWHASVGAMGRGSSMVPGVMRQQIVAHHSELVRMPAHFSFAEGATLPCAAVTAWHALCGAAPLQPGMTVLLQGAGGVSVFALQFAKLFGARVIMTTSSAERAGKLRALGADEVIDYREREDWDAAVKELTGNAGVDIVVEVGGAKTIDRSLAATRAGGRIAVVGLLSGPPQMGGSLMSASVDIQAIRVGSRADLEAITRAMSFHQARPVIDRVFPLAEFVEALRYLQSGSQFGKIVVSLEA